MNTKKKSMFDIIQFGLDECLINTDKWYTMPTKTLIFPKS